MYIDIVLKVGFSENTKTHMGQIENGTMYDGDFVKARLMIIKIFMYITLLFLYWKWGWSFRGAHTEKFTLARLASNFEFKLASAILHSLKKCLIWVNYPSFTLAWLARDFELNVTNENLHSSWWYCDAYVHTWVYLKFD